MNIGARTVTVLVVFLLVFVVGGILLQIYLSKRESKWPGLVLPALCMLYPILLVLNVAAVGDAGSVAATILASFVLGSIPALILLAIYFACRSGRSKKNELDKMNISDL